jgi:hypothetical protein
MSEELQRLLGRLEAEIEDLRRRVDATEQRADSRMARISGALWAVIFAAGYTYLREKGAL